MGAGSRAIGREAACRVVRGHRYKPLMNLRRLVSVTSHPPAVGARCAPTNRTASVGSVPPVRPVPSAPSVLSGGDAGDLVETADQGLEFAL